MIPLRVHFPFSTYTVLILRAENGKKKGFYRELIPCFHLTYKKCSCVLLQAVTVGCPTCLEIENMNEIFFCLPVAVSN